MRSNVIKIHMLAAALFLPLLFSAYATGIVPASAKTLVPDSGSGARVFTHIATALNSAGDWTDLDNSTTNNNPSAVVFVTPNWNPGGSGGTFDNHPIGVWYHSGKWAIFNENGTSIPNGAAFNVYALPSTAYSGVFIHTATAGNSAGDWTDLNYPAANNNPNALLLVTPNWNPGGSGGTYNNHPIGVWYHSGKWAIFNQDLTAIPTGASFNVMVLSTGTGQAFVHVATASNSAGNYTDISNRITNSHPDAIVFVTPNWNITGVYNNHPIGVWYHGTQWSIFNQDGAAVSTRAAFNVLAVRVRAV
jgi:hypothetical protein